MEEANNDLPNLRVGSFNCNGLSTPRKREMVLNWLKSKLEDIFLLQETHATSINEEAWKRTWGETFSLIMEAQIQLG